MAKTSHSWPIKKSTRVSEKNGKQVTEIKCSSCTAVQKKGNKVGKTVEGQVERG